MIICPSLMKMSEKDTKECEKKVMGCMRPNELICIGL